MKCYFFDVFKKTRFVRLEVRGFYFSGKMRRFLPVLFA
jgi:hypothetical protein